MTEEKKATLDEMLRLQAVIDAGMIVLSKEDFEITWYELKSKLDDYVGQMQIWEGNALGYKTQAKKLAEQGKVYENAIKNLKDRYKDLAVYYDQSELSGHFYKFSFAPTESIVTDIADKELTIEDKANFYEFIEEKTTYKWNKTALKEALKQGRELGFAKIETGLKLNIKPMPVSKGKKK